MQTATQIRTKHCNRDICAPRPFPASVVPNSAKNSCSFSPRLRGLRSWLGRHRHAYREDGYNPRPPLLLNPIVTQPNQIRVSKIHLSDRRAQQICGFFGGSGLEFSAFCHGNRSLHALRLAPFRLPRLPEKWERAPRFP